MADFEITEGDSSPSLAATLEDAEGTPVKLTDATVLFVMEPQRGAGTTPAATGAAFIEDPPEAGNVRYDWVAGDTDVTGGFDGRWVVTFQGGRKESFPNDGPFTIAIHPKQNPQGTVALLASTQAFAEARGVRHDPADRKALRALEDASGLFRSLARQTISSVENDAVELRGNFTPRLWLPERPVTGVTAVSIAAAGGVSVVPLASTSVTRRGLLTLGSVGDGPSSSISDPLWPWGGNWGGSDATVRVTYSHGYEVIPGDVVATVLTLAARRLQNILAAVSTTIAAYTVDFGGLAADEQAVIVKYRPVDA